jgi:histidinol-phosphatase (PHP family)
MGHIDYLKRYTPFEDNGIYYHENKEKIDRILNYLVSKDKAFEINTSGIDVHPFDFDILKRFKELGGRYVTLGSDAHNQEYLCRHFNSTIEKIKLCGFDKITYYENRNPVQINI